MEETIQAARRSLSDGHWHTAVFLGKIGAWQTKQELFDEAVRSLRIRHTTPHVPPWKREEENDATRLETTLDPRLPYLSFYPPMLIIGVL